jgi:hypothetical protein
MQQTPSDHAVILTIGGLLSILEAGFAQSKLSKQQALLRKRRPQVLIE